VPGPAPLFHDVKHVHFLLEHADWARMKRRLKTERRELSSWLRDLVAAELAKPDDKRNGARCLCENDARRS